MDFEEKLYEVSHTLFEGLEDIGVYASKVLIFVAQPQGGELSLEEASDEELEELLVKGELGAIIRVQAIMGDVAWSERVLYPEDVELRKAFENDMPNTGKIIIEALQDDFENGWGDDW